MPIDTSAEQEWEAARLIPIAGISGDRERERRAASALLAVIAAVPDFGHSLLKPMKAPKGRIRTYTEVRLKDQAGQTQTPDGVIVSERGKKRWACVVEFKTGRSQLDGTQVERYLGAAREHGFDGMLTISNQLSPDADWLPYDVDGRKLRGLSVRHLSWWAVLTEAILQHRFQGISDPDQAYMLGELVRYLSDERSGAAAFEGLGESWTAVREQVRHGSLRANDPGAREVAARWEQFFRSLCLTLSQELGIEVTRQGRKALAERVDTATAMLATDGVLSGAFRVPEAVGPVTIEASLATGQIAASVEIDAPKNRQRPTARVNWLLRQLEDASDDLRVDVKFANTKGVHSKRLGECTDDPNCLLLPEDPRREPRAFVLVQSRPMGRRTGRGGSAFIADTRKLATDFYRDLVQDLRAPAPRPPRLAKESEQAEHASSEPSVEGDAVDEPSADPLPPEPGMPPARQDVGRPTDFVERG